MQLKRVKQLLKKYSRILLFSFTLTIINFLAYLVSNAYFTSSENAYVLDNSIAIEMEDIRNMQGGVITTDQYKVLERKLHKPPSKKDLDEINEKYIFTMNVARDNAQIATLFLAGIIWLFTYFFLNGTSEELIPLLVFPLLFSVTELLPVANFFIIIFIISVVYLYKSDKSKRGRW